MAYATGGNFEILVEGDVATCRVWKRPDVDSATGAQFAEAKIQHFAALARAGTPMVFDLSDAPPVAGPKSTAAIGRMLAAYQAAGVTIVLVAGDNATQRLQLRRLVEEHAPTQGQIATSRTEALHAATRGRHS